MKQIFDLFKGLLADPNNLMQWINTHGGLYVVMAIVFAETGLFLGFFLPGDSLLFITGMIIANSQSPFQNVLLNLGYWLVLISAAAIAGNLLGFWFGRESGHLWFEKKDTLFFKKKNLLQAHDYFEQKGSLAIIMGRFLPIVRTFVPMVAGIVNMSFRKFFLYSVIGGLAWVLSMTLTGFMLGTNEFVKHNIDKITIVIILVTTGPVLFKMFFGKKKEAVGNDK
jgi:membrane-associated protein